MSGILWLLAVVTWTAHAQQPFGETRRTKEQDAFVRMVRHNDGSRTVTSKHSGSATGLEVDQRTQLVETYDKDGNLKLQRRYHLDDKGQPQHFQILNGAKVPLLKGQFVYDSFGRMSQEILYSMDGRMIRRLNQNYDYSGKKLDPKVENFEALPAEILYWMDPDSASDQVKAAMNNSGGKTPGTKDAGGKPAEKPGILGRIFGKK